MQIDGDGDPEMEESAKVAPEVWYLEYLSLPRELRASFFR